MCLILAISAAAAGAAPPPDAAGQQELMFSVAVPADAGVTRVWVEVEWLGEHRTLPLRDDGSEPGDAGDDGVFVGRARGPFVRLLPTTLMVQLGETLPMAVYEGIVTPSAATFDVHAWRLHENDTGWSAHPAAFAYPGRAYELAEALPLVAYFGWGVFLTCLVGVAVMRSRRRDGGRGDD